MQTCILDDIINPGILTNSPAENEKFWMKYEKYFLLNA